MSFLRVLTIFDVVIYLTSRNVVHYVVPGFAGGSGSEGDLVPGLSRVEVSHFASQVSQVGALHS